MTGSSKKNIQITMKNGMHQSIPIDMISRIKLVNLNIDGKFRQLVVDTSKDIQSQVDLITRKAKKIV